MHAHPREPAGQTAGRWIRDDWGLPAFRCRPVADARAPRAPTPYHRAGNDRLWFVADARGWLRMYESSRGRRLWHDMAGWAEVDGYPTTTDCRATWGPGYARFVCDTNAGISVDRLTIAPHGDAPYLLSRISVRVADGSRRRVRWIERWPLRPMWLSAPATTGERREAAATLRYRRRGRDMLTVVTEIYGDESPALANRIEAPLVPPDGSHVWLGWLDGSERFDDFEWVAGERALSSTFILSLDPREEVVLWLATGVGAPPEAFTSVRRGTPGEEVAATVQVPDDSVARRPAVTVPATPSAGRRILPDRIIERHFSSWRRNIAGADVEGLPGLDAELAWACVSNRQAALGDDTEGVSHLDPGGSAAFGEGVATIPDIARHALPLVYVAPNLARSSLVSILSRCGPQPGRRHVFTGGGIRHPSLLEPCDADLWALWLGVEYLAATGDLELLDREVACWPQPSVRALWPRRFADVPAGPVLPVREVLRRCLDTLAGDGGTGVNGLVAMGMWDGDPTLGAAGGESVTATAMARYVVPRYVALCHRLGDHATAERAAAFAAALERPLENAWGKHHYMRATTADGTPLGVKQLFLEPQVWAILSGDAERRAAKLLDHVDSGLRHGSPLGARVRAGGFGEGWNGGVSPSLSALLVWAAAAESPGLARDELGRMQLQSHAAAYPEQWWGVWGGPEIWDAPESRTAGGPALVGATAPHSGLLHATLRLFGVGVGPAGVLRIAPTPAVAGGRLRLPRIGIDVSMSCRRIEGQVFCDGPMSADICGEERTLSAGWNLL